MERPPGLRKSLGRKQAASYHEGGGLLGPFNSRIFPKFKETGTEGQCFKKAERLAFLISSSSFKAVVLNLGRG